MSEVRFVGFFFPSQPEKWMGKGEGILFILCCGLFSGRGNFGWVCLNGEGVCLFFVCT